MSTGSEVYITPAQYQELRRRSTNMYVPPDAPTNLQQPSVAPLAPMPSSQIPSSPAAGASTGMIEG